MISLLKILTVRSQLFLTWLLFDFSWNNRSYVCLFYLISLLDDINGSACQR